MPQFFIVHGWVLSGQPWYESAWPREIEHAGFLELGALEPLSTFPHYYESGSVSQPDGTVLRDAEGTYLCGHRVITKKSLGRDGSTPRT